MGSSGHPFGRDQLGGSDACTENSDPSLPHILRTLISDCNPSTTKPAPRTRSKVNLVENDCKGTFAIQTFAKREHAVGIPKSVQIRHFREPRLLTDSAKRLYR
jgi:hypothetical protein